MPLWKIGLAGGGGELALSAGRVGGRSGVWAEISLIGLYLILFRSMTTFDTLVMTE